MNQTHIHIYMPKSISDAFVEGRESKELAELSEVLDDYQASDLAPLLEYFEAGLPSSIQSNQLARLFAAAGKAEKEVEEQTSRVGYFTYVSLQQADAFVRDLRLVSFADQMSVVDAKSTANVLKNNLN
jgi:hypothetical protein